MFDLRRREFIWLLGGAAAAWPIAARAQQRAMPVIGFLNSASPEAFAPFVVAFEKWPERSRLCRGAERGHRYRWAEGKDDQLQVLAAELVRQQVAIASLPVARIRQSRLGRRRRRYRSYLIRSTR